MASSIINKNANNVKITVKNISKTSSQSKLVRLNLSDNLLAIRQELKQNYEINDILLFLVKTLIRILELKMFII